MYENKRWGFALSLSRKPIIYLLVALLTLGAFFSTFFLYPPIKTAHAAGEYYVEKVGGTQFKYLQNAWPTAGTGTNCSSNNLQSCLNTINNIGNATMVIHPGTYIGADLSGTGNLATFANKVTTIRGPKPGDVDYSSHTDPVIIDGTSAGNTVLFTVSNTGITLEKLTLQNLIADKFAIDAYENIVMNDMTIKSTGRGLHIRKDVQATRTIVRDTQTDTPLYLDATTGTGTFSNCIFDGTEGPSYFGYIGYNQNNVVTFNNTIFTGFRSKVMYGGNASIFSVTCNGCIFSGNNLEPSAFTIIDTVGHGTWVFNNSLLGGTPTEPTSTSFLSNPGGTATVTYSNNSTAYNPLWVSNSREGRAYFAIDDSAGYSAWKQVADLADTYGYKTSFGVNFNDYSSINWPELGTYVQNGHEVSSHARDDTRVGILGAFTAAKAGATITVTINRPDAANSCIWPGQICDPWTGTLRYQDSVPTDQTISLNIDGSYETMKKVVTFLQGKGVTIGGVTDQMSYTGAGANDKTTPLMLASGTYNIGTTQTINFDETSQFVVEMKEAKVWLEGMMQNPAYGNIPGWTAKSFIWPGSRNSANSRTYVLGTAGFLEARNARGSSFGVRALNLADTGAASLQDNFGTGDANIRKRVDGYLQALAQKGAVGGIYSHIYNSDWVSVFEAVKNSTARVTVDTFNGSYDWVRNASAFPQRNVVGTISYACTNHTESCLADQSNYHLTSSSPAIDSGIDVNINTDYTGKQRYDMPGVVNTGSVGAYTKNYVDIGAYEYVTPPDPVLSSTACPDEAAWCGDTTPDIVVNQTSSTTSFKYLINQVLAPLKSAIEAGTADSDGSFTVPDITINADGTWYVHEIAQNLDGDSSNNYDTYTLKYDSTPPIGFTPTANPPSWTSTDSVDLTFATTDATSGIANYKTKVDSGAYGGDITSPYTLDTSGLGNGDHTVTIKATDNAGNAREETVNIHIDRTAPLAFTPTADPAGYTSGDITLTFSTTDALSDVANYKYKLDSGVYGSNITSPYVLAASGISEGAHTVTIKATDNAGNYREGTVSIYLDKTAPTISDGMPSGTLSSGTTSASLAVATNKAATCKYSSTTGTSYAAMTNTFSTTGGTSHSTSVSGLSSGSTYHYYVRCQDNAGNPTSSDYTITFSIANPSSSTTGETSANQLNQQTTQSPSATAQDNITNNKKESVIEKLERFFTTKILWFMNQKVVETVKFQIVDKDGKPISNIDVTIHSDPQTAKTNENGVVTFSKVPVGKHLLAFNFDGSKFSKKVSVADPNAQEGTFQAEILTIKAEKDPTPLWVWITIGVLSVLVLYFGYAFFARRKRSY